MRKLQLAFLATVLVFIGIIIVNLLQQENPQFESNAEEITTSLHELQLNQRCDGSWDNDSATTALASYALVKSGIDSQCVYKNAEGVTVSIANSSVSNAAAYLSYYESTYPVNDMDNLSAAEKLSFTETQSYTIIATSAFSRSTSVNLSRCLVAQQLSEGSWNGNVTETALAVYALKVSNYDNKTVLESGINWLQQNKGLDFYSVKEEALMIIALNASGLDVSNEVRAVAERQKPDGSFGAVEETSWAIIALSKSQTSDAIKARSKAVEWLRHREFANDRERALSTLALIESNQIVIKTAPPSSLSYTLVAILAFTIILILGLFARLSDNDILKGVRKKIYEYIKLHPGEHLNRLRKIFTLSPNAAEYHTSVLEKNNLIVSYKDSRYKRFYVNGNGYSACLNGKDYKPVIAVLKNKTAGNIAQFLSEHKETNQLEVARSLSLHPSTIHWHTDRLEKVGVLCRRRKGKYVFYSMIPEVSRILSCI
ncbi:MAG: hypothetical protein AB1485_06125 [Candidatus Thermoplasmatota archaeon]